MYNNEWMNEWIKLIKTWHDSHQKMAVKTHCVNSKMLKPQWKSVCYSKLPPIKVLRVELRWWKYSSHRNVPLLLYTVWHWYIVNNDATMWKQHLTGWIQGSHVRIHVLDLFSILCLFSWMDNLPLWGLKQLFK